MIKHKDYHDLTTEKDLLKMSLFNISTVFKRFIIEKNKKVL